MPDASLSLLEARRIAITAAGIPGSVEDPAAVLRRLGSVQLDAISALAQAHLLTIATRLPHGTITDVATALWTDAQALAFEYPAHAAALVQIEDWPLWAFRRRASRQRSDYPAQGLCTALLARVDALGPLRLRDLRDESEANAGGWDWSPTKTAVQFLTWSGDLVCVRRDPAGHRLFDVADRTISAGFLDDSLSDDECVIRLLDRAGDAMGVGTVDDFADYLRVRAVTARALLPQSSLTPVMVEGWTGQAWASSDALGLAGSKVTDAAFLGPFDNLIWHRKRVKRLFHFDHVLEAYKPAAQRQHGYYVCPLRVGTDLVGRADLACSGGTLTVRRTSMNVLDEPTIAGYAEACTTLATAVGATEIHICDDAADSRTLAALRRASRNSRPG